MKKSSHSDDLRSGTNVASGAFILKTYFGNFFLSSILQFERMD